MLVSPTVPKTVGYMPRGVREGERASFLKDVPWVEFMHLVLKIPTGESYRGRLRSVAELV